MRLVLATIAILLCCPAAYAQSKSSDYTADYQQTALEYWHDLLTDLAGN